LIGNAETNLAKASVDAAEFSEPLNTGSHQSTTEQEAVATWPSRCPSTKTVAP